MSMFWIVTFGIVIWSAIGVWAVNFFEKSAASKRLPASLDWILAVIVVLVGGPVVWAFALTMYVTCTVKFLQDMFSDELMVGATSGLLLLAGTVTYFFVSHYLGYI